MRRPRMPGSATGLEGVLGHGFRDAGLLEQALTHPSASSPARPDNQRLEFLGDRVLGLCVAEALLQAYPDAAEGALAPRFNALVRRETLAEVAAEIGLGQHLRLGRSEAISGGRRKAAILADAAEAVIAALYLDGGMEAARGFIARHWRGRLHDMAATPTDAKTQAQEWAQARGLAPPVYRLAARSGPDHAPLFTVEAGLETGETATGQAGSKKLAEQEAAQALMGRIAPPAPETDLSFGPARACPLALLQTSPLTSLRSGGGDANGKRPARSPMAERVPETSGEPVRCGFVALIGEPNAGKSTLLNRMVGAKVSIVTHKVQTTRTRIRGIAVEGSAQIVFVDTPGLFRPRRRLDRAMVASAWAGAEDADIVVLLVEAHRGITDGVEAILEALDAHVGAHAGARTGAGEGARPVALAVNKIDRVRRPALLPLLEQLAARRNWAETFLISAETGDGVADLKRWLAAALPEGPWHYPEDQIADMALRQIAAEITREKLTLRLHQELPYQLTVETEAWDERRDGSVRIEQVIYVGRDGHKGIVLGRGGETVKAIGQEARRDIAELIGRPAHLFLTVKARPNWQDEPERYREMGLDFSDGQGNGRGSG